MASTFTLEFTEIPDGQCYGSRNSYEVCSTCFRFFNHSTLDALTFWPPTLGIMMIVLLEQETTLMIPR